MVLHGSPTVERMPRTPRRIVALLLAGAAVAALAACAPAAPAATDAPPDSPEATRAPIFASDEEALAAAVAAFDVYSSASSIVGQEGGQGIERLQSTVAPELYNQLADEFAALGEAGLHIEGEPLIYRGSLAERSESPSSAAVSAYFCRDVSPTRVLDSKGGDVTPTTREAVQALLAHFVSKGDSPETLIVESMERWPDASFC